ncbi:hypothetical protein [Streptomyces griseus]|uniref:hypothetical protein n=1 Tax=Streptomyces griseus TaxID=1911 RepID=UPI00131C5C46|nr:hypothetical protein [Streptomyces griseus]
MRLALLLLVAGAVALLFWVPALSALGWAAVVAGLSAAIAGAVQGLVTSGIGKGQEVVLGGAPPIAVQAVFTHQELALVRQDGTRGQVHCGYVKMSVEALVPHAVVLRLLNVVVDGRQPALHLETGPQQAPLPYRKFLVDLDISEPRLVPQGSADFPYVVTQTGPEIFEVMAYTGGQCVDWHLELEVVSQGETCTVVVDDDGRPFRVSYRTPAQPE